MRSTTTRLSFFSPSQLNAFLECEHLTHLTQNVARTGDSEERPRTAHSDLLARKGEEHELAWLHKLQAEGRVVLSLQCLQGEPDWISVAGQTLSAMRAGVEVIYQGDSIAKLSLAGTYAAITEMLKCQTEMEARGGSTRSSGDVESEAKD